VLQPVDIAIAFFAAHHTRQQTWAPKIVREELRIPWSSIQLSLARLRNAGIFRGSRVSRMALATLLPSLQYLVPARPDGAVVLGVPTGVSSPGLEGRLVVSIPMVWASERGTVRGKAIKPLFRTLPDASLDHPDLHLLFGALDAARTGRARELRLAREVLGDLLDLPRPMAA
jgi:hypothetical protein